MDFNDEIAVDIFYLYDHGKIKRSILSVMDLASGYHVCRKIQSKLSKDLAESVRQLWEWAGMPKRLVCDQERGFQKDFVDEMENRGIQVKYIAGQAHWQLGQLERQQGWMRTVWEKVVESVDYQEADWALLQVAQAKNHLRRRHGYSPAQWALGVQPRMEDGLAEGEAEPLPTDTVVRGTGSHLLAANDKEQVNGLGRAQWWAQKENRCGCRVADVACYVPRSIYDQRSRASWGLFFRYSPCSETYGNSWNGWMMRRLMTRRSFTRPTTSWRRRTATPFCGWPEGVPRRRMRQKGPMPLATEVKQAPAEDEPEED